MVLSPPGIWPSWRTTSTISRLIRLCPSFDARRSGAIQAVREALNELGGKISDQEMRRLNYAVDGEHRDVVEVVREFLRAKHLD